MASKNGNTAKLHRLDKAPLERKPNFLCQLCGMDEATLIISTILYDKDFNRPAQHGKIVLSRQVSVCETCGCEGWIAYEEFITA